MNSRWWKNGPGCIGRTSGGESVTKITSELLSKSECKEVRRAVFHTESFELSDDEVEGYIKDLIFLLEDKKKLYYDPAAKEAVLCLKQLSQGTIKVTLQTELEVSKEVQKQILSEKANISVKEEEIQAVSQLRDFVQQNIKDVDEQHQSFQLVSTEEQDFKAMDHEQQSLLYQSIADTEGKVKQNLEDFSRTLKGDVKQLVDEALAEIKRHVNENQGRFLDPQNQFDKIKQQLRLLDNRANKLEQSFSTIKERFSKFEHLEQLHKQDMNRQTELSDYLRRRNALQEELCKKYENQLSRVNIPFCSNVSVDLMRIHEEQQIQPLYLEGYPRTSEDTIRGYKDILCKDGRLCQKMALLGNMGHGKTLMCQRLIQDWISAVRKVKSNQGCRLSEDESFLAELSLIFYIQLEHAVEDCSVFEMICKQTFGYPVDSFPNIQPLKHKTVLEVFEREPNQCLVIMDSLDKWNSTKSESRKGLHNEHLPIQEITGTCPTMITSRHCKFNAILHTLAPSDFDNIFEVCGFKNKKQAAEILITIFSDADQTAQENIEVEEIQSFLLQSAICGLRDIPAIMHYIIWAVFTFQSLQESQTEMVSRIIVHLFEYMSTGDRKSIEASTSNIGEQLFQKNSCHPEVFRCSDVMDKYKVLVSKLSRAAFHDVFSTGDQSPLILTESELRNYFLKEELEEALKSGILIQKKVTGSNLQRRMQLSFLCESLQHFFAALHVAGSVGQERKDLVDKLLKFCLIEDRIYRMENFLLFVFCMVPDLCKVLSQLYFERKLTELTDIKILDRFTCLLKRLMKELDIYNRESTKIYLFYMDAIKMSLTDFSRNDEALILKLYMDNLNNLKQLTALTDVVDTSIHTDEQLTRISSYILKHLASASCLVKLHLANIVLVDGGSVLSSLKTLEDLHLENVRNTTTEWITINLTNCTGLQILKCSLLQKMELTVSSTLLEMIHFHNCRSVNLTMQKVSDWYMWFFTNDERRKLKSIDCADLEFCAIDFHDIFMKMDALVLNRCSDCKFTFDHVRLEDDDPVSPKDSSLLDYMPNFNKIWSNPGESKISSINSVNINSCKRVKVSAFVIVSSCVVENCTDIEVLIQSNEKCRDVFAESLEEVSQSFNLKVIVVENIRTEHERSQIKLLRLPVCLEKMLISNCIACDISVDCFDQDDALAKAESYFIKSSSQLDSCLQNNKEVYMDQLMKCDIRMKTTNIALNVVNIKNCQSTTFALEQVSPNTSLLQNPGHILSLEPIIHKLKISNLADCRLNGLEGGVVKNIILLSCELVWNELGLKDMQSLHIESLSDSAVEICRSLIGCQSIRNLVCRHISPRMMKTLEAIVPSLPNLTSVDLSDKGENIAALVHSLAVCSIDSINFDHVDGKNILELVKYKNLEHLCLNLSDSSCPAIVMKTLPELKHLKGLEFTDCSDDALRALGNLSKELKSVEWFRLSHCHGLGQGSDTTATVLHCVSAMPKLRKLTLVDVPAEVLPALQKYEMKYLETFEIGPVLGEVTTHHFCFLLNQPKLQKVICCRLNSCALCRVMDTVSKMKTGVSVQMNEMGSLIKATLDSLKHVQQVEGLMYHNLQCDSVASVLQNRPSSVKFLCLSGASCVESYGSPQRNSEPEINKVKQVKASSMTKKHQKGVIQFTWNINTLELSHLNLNSLVIEGMQNLKTVKELKLNGVIEVDVESLGRCIGMLRVEVLTLSNILFKESGLNLSNAYRLRIITLHRVYMHTQFWINFFEKLPKLMDVRESGLVTLLGCKTGKKIGNDNYELPSVICSRNGKSVNNSHKEGSNAFTEATANSQDRNTVISSEGNKNERCCASPIGDHKSEHFSVIYSRTNQDVSKLDAQGDKATTEPVGDSRVSKRSHKLCHAKSTIEVEISDIVDRCNEVTNTETKDNEARSSEAAAKVGYGVARDQEALVREPERNVEEPRDMGPHEMEAAAENGERLSTGSEFVFVEKVERKHSTCIKEILLRKVCITQEVIRAVSNLGLFSNESWSCIRMTEPAVYDGSLSLMGKK